MTATEFKPTFRSDVGVVNALTSPPQFSAINPTYCLSEQSAVDLQSLLLDLKPQIVHDWPMSGWPQANAYYQTAQVPYLKFPDGTTINAGFEAAFFHSWISASFRRGRSSRNDIAITQQASAAASGI